MKLKLLGLAFVCALAAAAPSVGSGPPIVARMLAVGKMQATTIDVKAGTTVLDVDQDRARRKLRLAHARLAGRGRRDRGTLTVFDPTVAGCAAVQGLEGTVVRRAREPRPSRPQRRHDTGHGLRAVPRCSRDEPGESPLPPSPTVAMPERLRRSAVDGPASCGPVGCDGTM